jgi:hypothetical protein
MLDYEILDIGMLDKTASPFIVKESLMMIVIYNLHIFIVQIMRKPNKR